MALGLLFLCLRGAWLARIAHRALGLPAVHTLQHARLTESLLVSSHQPTTLELKQNLLISLNAGLFNKESPILADALSKTCGYVLMFDEIKIEEIIRYSATNNHIVGVCREHSGTFVLEYSTAHKALQLFEGVKEGDVHIATEVSTCPLWVISYFSSDFQATIGALGYLSPLSHIYNITHGQSLYHLHVNKRML